MINLGQLSIPPINVYGYAKPIQIDPFNRPEELQKGSDSGAATVVIIATTALVAISIIGGYLLLRA